MKKWLAVAVGVTTIFGGWFFLRGGPVGNAEWRLTHKAAALEFGARVVPLGERDVWAFGTRRFGYWTLGPRAYHWDGAEWSRVGLPADAGKDLLNADASSPSNVWAMTSGEEGVRTHRWNGHAWTTQPTTPATSAEDLLVLADDDAWVFGDQTWHYTASGWTRADLPMYAYRASARSASDIWAIGRTEQGGEHVAHYDGASWQIVPVDLPRDTFLTGVTADATGIWITANVDDMKAQTTTPILLSRTDGKWRTEQVPGGGPWRETFAPIPDGRGGHWFLNSTDENAYDSALAHRSAGGVWTLAPASGTPDKVEFTTLTAVPGINQLLATGSFEGTPGIFVHHWS